MTWIGVLFHGEHDGEVAEGEFDLEVVEIDVAWFQNDAIFRQSRVYDQLASNNRVLTGNVLVRYYLCVVDSPPQPGICVGKWSSASETCLRKNRFFVFLQ